MNLSIASIFAKSFRLYLVLALLTGLIAFAAPGVGAAEEGQPAKTGPQNLRVATDENGNPLLTHNSVQFTWDLVGDETDPNNIDVWAADQDNDDSNDKYIAWGNRWTHVIGNLTPETTYSVYITWDADRPSHAYKSNVLTFTTKADTSVYPEPPLVPPQHLHTTAVTDSSITLAWTGTPGANGYDVYVNGGWTKGVWDGSNTVTIDVPNDPSVTGSVYKIEVGAQNMPKISANSNPVTITWGQLEAPKDVQAVTATRTDVSLGWAETPGATGYDIYADGALIGSSADNRYVATGLQEGRAYAFKVVAKNGVWRSPDSAAATVVPGADYNIVTYYALWAASATGRNFHPSDADVSKLTHINLAFSDLCWRGYGSNAAACLNQSLPLQQDYVYDGEMVVGDPSADPALFAQWAAIRDANPHLKLLVSVGGWSWSNNFSNMASTEETRRAFANSVVEFLRLYKLDGIDIDWEYPVEGGEEDNSRSPADRDNFLLMARTVREALDAAGSVDGKYYLQTIASSQGDNFVANSRLAESSRYLDFINVMTYDYSGNWDTLAHHNSPLYYDPKHPKDYAPRNNALGGILGELNGGVPHYKISLGVPFYGKGWIGCPSDGHGEYRSCAGATPFGTWENGAFDYSDIVDNYMTKEGFAAYWNNASKVAYLYNPETGVFLTYNDARSMMYIASLVRSLDLPGVMSWEISGDRDRTLSTRLATDLPVNGVPNAAALAAPTGLQVAYAQTNSLSVKWNASASATAYEVYVGKVLAGTTADTTFALAGLTPDTTYVVEVLAIAKDGDTLKAVSPFSVALSAKTAPVPAPIGYGPPPTAPAKDGLETRTARSGDAIVVDLPVSSALTAISSARSSEFAIVVEGEAKQANVNVPKEVADAIRAKDGKAAIVVKWNGASFEIPIASLPAGTEIRISLGAPERETADAWTKLLAQDGLDAVVAPLSFRIEGKKADGGYEELTAFNDRYLTHAFRLDATPYDSLAGVVYAPQTNELRPVPVRFEKNADGTVAAELLRQGNSVYGVVRTKSPASFRDALPEWARDSIELAVARRLIGGDTAAAFGAGRELTRGEVVSLVVRALGMLPDEKTTPFEDVAAGSAHAGDIAAAHQAGLVNGRGDGLFDPSAAITREEFAAILAKALAYSGDEKPADLAALNRYADKATVSAYAKAPLALLVEREIMLGVSADRLAPKSNVTKSQAVVLVVKLLRSAGLSD